MPEKTYKVISGDFVDVIQDLYDTSSTNRFKRFSTQKDFVTAILNHDTWNPIEVFSISDLLDNLDDGK